MIEMQSRRQLLTLLAATPLLALPACTGMGGWTMTDAVRELLTLSSQRAIASLAQPGGFYDSQIARITVPQNMGNNSSILGRLLTSQLLKDRLTREVNIAAERGAERAAPMIMDAVRTVSITDAVSILRGGPTAATSLLQRQIGTNLISAMFPAVGDALAVANSPVMAEVVRITSGIDVSGFTSAITEQTSNAIFRAIGEEERAIRANPQQTRNPILIAALTLGG